MPAVDDETSPLLSGRTGDASLVQHTNRGPGYWGPHANECLPAQPDHSKLQDDVLPEDSVLGRNIGWGSAYILAISRVIGSGIFAVPGVVLESVGSVGMSLTLWVLGAIVTACGLAVSLEYGCMLPRSGGEKVYLEFTYPWPRFLASTLVATQAVLLGFTASNCIIFSQYVHWALGMEPEGYSKKLLAVALMTAITIVHGCWYRAGIRIQNFLGWIKVGLVILMAAAALYVVVFRPHQPSSGEGVVPETRVGLWDDTNWGFGTLATSLFKVLYSYTGLQNLTYVLNEVRNPVRTLKSVSIVALITACLLYLLCNLAYFAVIPTDQIKESGQLVAALFFELTFGERVGRRLLPLAVALSAAGNVMVVTFSLVCLETWPRGSLSGSPLMMSRPD